MNIKLLSLVTTLFILLGCSENTTIEQPYNDLKAKQLYLLYIPYDCSLCTANQITVGEISKNYKQKIVVITNKMRDVELDYLVKRNPFLAFENIEILGNDKLYYALIKKTNCRNSLFFQIGDNNQIIKLSS